MIILAIDPGYDRMGLAVIEKIKGKKESLLFSTCVVTDRKNSHGDRLAAIANAIRESIKKYHPDCLAIETLFFSKNQKTALKVAEARGVIISAAAQAGLIIKEYSPADIKIAVTGYGKSDKKQILAMVPRLIKISKKADFDDEIDAIATGLTCVAIEHF